MWFTATQLSIYFLINQLKIHGGIIMKTNVQTSMNAIVRGFSQQYEIFLKNNLLNEQKKEKRKWNYII